MLLFDVKPAGSTIYDNLTLVELMVAIITNWNYLIKKQTGIRHIYKLWQQQVQPKPQKNYHKARSYEINKNWSQLSEPELQLQNSGLESPCTTYHWKWKEWQYKFIAPQKYPVSLCKIIQYAHIYLHYIQSEISTSLYPIYL
jgi:hypothetical protein